MLRGCLLAALVAAIAGEVVAGESLSAESTRSPAQAQAKTSTIPTLSVRAQHRALVVDLGPLSAVEEQSKHQTFSTKRQRIGVHRLLPKGYSEDLAAQLTWVKGERGAHTAVVIVRSPEAVSVRVAVRAKLPHNAALQIYDGNGRTRGPSYAMDRFASRTAPVWLPDVEGDTLTLQITVPSAEATGGVTLAIASVAHRYASAVPKSGLDCDNHVDVACLTDPTALLLADATAVIEYENVGASYVCSGTLLNTAHTPDIFEPYFLTAHHCVSNALAADSVVAWWFWHNTSCGGFRADSRYVETFGGTTLLETNVEQDASLLMFKDALPGGLVYSGWTTREVLPADPVHSLHHPAGSTTRYSRGGVHRIGMALVGDMTLRNALYVDWAQGVTEGGSSGSGLFNDGWLIGPLSGGPPNCGGRGDIFGSFRDFFPQIAQWLSPPPPVVNIYQLPFLMPQSNQQHRGVLRLVNLSEQAGEVEVYAIDDEGGRFGPHGVSLAAGQSREITSEQLEQAVGNGRGSWRVEVQTFLEVDARAYLRFSDNHMMTTVHDVVPQVDGRHHVPIFYPSRYRNKSFLRLVNPGDEAVNLTITGVTAAGETLEGRASLRLEPGTARMLTAQQIERGDPALTGHMGSATQPRRLFIDADGPLWVLNLMKSPWGRVANLSTTPQALQSDAPDAPEEPQGDFAPLDAAAFYALVRGRAFELTFTEGAALGRNARLQLTSYDGDNPYSSDNGRIVASTRLGHHEGGWSYSNSSPSTGLLSINFRHRSRNIREKCFVNLRFIEAERGDVSSTCLNRDTRQELAGEGTFEIQPLF